MNYFLYFCTLLVFLYMKHVTHRLFLCMLLLVGCASTMNAQAWGRRGGLTGDNYHFGYLSGSVGYSMLQMNAAGAVSKGDVGGSVGLGYEFRNNGFWTSVGAQMSFHRSSLLVDTYTRDYDGHDTQGKATTFHYRVDQVDVQEWNFIDVPILFGYYVHGFHIGAGPKLSYALNPKSHLSGTYNLSATNKDYNVTFENMPDRGYTDYQFDGKYNNRLNIGVSIVGEIGYDLLKSVQSRSRLCHVLKLSFYFEYGLNNFAGKWDTKPEMIIPDPSNATKATVYPYINTLQDTRIVPFFAGAKLTYMIGGSRTARAGLHTGCMCYGH